MCDKIDLVFPTFCGAQTTWIFPVVFFYGYMKRIQLGGHRAGSQIKGYALVDDRDFKTLNQFNWFTDGRYARRRVAPGVQEYMHHAICKVVEGENVDHINGNKLDNRRSNLRICTVSQNGANRDKQKNNSSGFKGVFWNKRDNKWLAQIRVQRKQIYLGQYVDKELAAHAYNSAVQQYYGKYGRTNQI